MYIIRFVASGEMGTSLVVFEPDSHLSSAMQSNFFHRLLLLYVRWFMRYIGCSSVQMFIYVWNLLPISFCSLAYHLPLWEPCDRMFRVYIYIRREDPRVGSAEMPHGNSIVYLMGMFAFLHYNICDSNEFYNYDKKHLNLVNQGLQ